jgi:hypothetical protein
MQFSMRSRVITLDKWNLPNASLGSGDGDIGGMGSFESYLGLEIWSSVWTSDIVMEVEG